MTADDRHWAGTLAIGFVRDFRDGPTIVILGDAVGSMWLAADLRSLAETPRMELNVCRSGYARVYGSLTLVVRHVGSYAGARGVVNVSDHGCPHFAWLLDSGMLQEAADKIDSLSDPAARSGHQYLTIEMPENAQVMMSRGEYEASIYERAE